MPRPRRRPRHLIRVRFRRWRLPSLQSRSARPISWRCFQKRRARAAAAAAEWFVIDYFTVDGGAGSRERVAARGSRPGRRRAAARTGGRSVLRGMGTRGPGRAVRPRVVRRDGRVRQRCLAQWRSHHSPAGEDGGGHGCASPMSVRPEIVGVPRPQATTRFSRCPVSPVSRPPRLSWPRRFSRQSTFGDEPEAVGAYRTGRRMDGRRPGGGSSSGIRWPLAIVVDE